MTLREMPLLPLVAVLALVATPMAAQIRPLGPEFEVSANRGVIDLARAAFAPDGTFLVAWSMCDWATDGRDCTSVIRARRFDAQGQPLGDEFQVNDDTSTHAYLSELTVSTDGTILVAWGRDERFGYDVTTRALDSGGSPVGPETTVRVSRRGELVGTEDDHRVSLAAAPDGTFLAAWDMVFRRTNRIEAQRFNARGQPVGEPFRLNPEREGSYVTPDVAFMPNGDLIASWIRLGGSRRGYEYFVEAARFTSEGEQIGEVVVVDDLTLPREKSFTQITPLEGGGFAVVWRDGLRNEEILGRQLDGRNRPVGGRLRVSTASGLRWDPQLVAYGRGRAISTWESVSPGGRTGLDIHTRVLERKGRASGAEFNLTPEGIDSQAHPSAVTSPTGTVLVTWVDQTSTGTARVVEGRLLEIGSPVRAWPKRPTRLRAEAISPTEVRLSWRDNAELEEIFEVQAAAGSTWVTVATASADAGGIDVAGLSSGAGYRFRVRAVNGSGPSKWSNRARATLPQ